MVFRFLLDYWFLCKRRLEMHLQVFFKKRKESWRNSAQLTSYVKTKKNYDLQSLYLFCIPLHAVHIFTQPRYNILNFTYVWLTNNIFKMCIYIAVNIKKIDFICIIYIIYILLSYTDLWNFRKVDSFCIKIM